MIIKGSNPTDLSQQRTTNPYERQFNYSRALKKGPFIFISGTTSVSIPESTVDTLDSTTPSTPTILHPTSAFLQAQHIFRVIAGSVRGLGGNPATDIVRVRMFVTHDEDAADVGRALKESGFAVGEDGEGFGPAATMILGVRFVHPDMKVEIEADAVVL